MNAENPGWRGFVADTVAKAEAVLASEHVGAAVQTVIKDFLQITRNVDALMHNQVGQSADARVLKKRLDQAKTEMRAHEQKAEAVKGKLHALIEEVKIVSGEAAQIQRRHEASSAPDPDATSAVRIKAAAQKIAEIIVQLSQN